MKAGTMEGLIGASINMELTRTPFKVYKEAERKGDTAAMERAMGYVVDFQEKAQECSDRAQEELPKELEEERREQEIRREEALERREETEEFIENVRKNNNTDTSETDSVEISEEGRAVLENSPQAEQASPALESTDAKLYTSDGKPISAEPSAKSDDIKVNITI